MLYRECCEFTMRTPVTEHEYRFKEGLRLLLQSNALMAGQKVETQESLQKLIHVG